ncbi:MAG: SDR family NAD(P)-dependent oxidoreductase, partial [Alphaproteobacteria bacterium]|nr:SDR family NAD(P)-dependent oxidoreductase [Alphaproteobacteria bacterium]
MLKGKAVLVTGAGGGIGREMAILCAREGAKVVVNDLGGAVDGEGAGSQTPAQKVCEEIKAFGGVAIPNYGSVADPAAAEAMIKQSVENFGKIDGVINNAGILRDRIFHRMSHLDWKQVIDVHLNGAFNTSRAAANYFKEQKSGAFVHFTSTSGLVGNFGQANYSAAKMGIVGLSRSIALDM